MGKALKKGEDYTQLNRMKWAAWGVIDIEALDIQQRNNYINHVRQELAQHGCILECGANRAQGRSRGMFYRIAKLAPPAAAGERPKTEWQEVTSWGTDNAFQRICLKVLQRLDPDHAREP